MIIAGRVENGVVVVDDAASLPEGAQVAVVVPAALALESEPVSEADQQRRLAIIDRITALPIEGETDPFSGRGPRPHARETVMVFVDTDCTSKIAIDDLSVGTVLTLDDHFRHLGTVQIVP